MADVEPASAGADAARKAAATETAAATDAKSSQLQQQPADAVAKELADTAAEASATGEAAAAAAGDVPHLTFKVQYGKQSQELKRPATSTIADLKAEVERALAIPPARQKLMFRGLLKNDTDTLEQVGIKNGAKVLLIGSSQADIAAAKPADAGLGSKDLAWDAPKVQEDITKQPQHAKIISKGVPEDAMPGLADKQVPLPDTMLAFNNLLNQQGNKVRLTCKPDIQQLWIASATNTQKIPYSTITKIESWPIAEAPGYSVLALHLGVGGASRYWLYFYPSQYVSGIKIRLLGVQALL